MKERILAYLKSTFSEADGTGSASRLLAGATVGMSLVWISYIVFTQHHLPDLGGADKIRKLGVAVRTLVSFEGH